MCNLGKISLEFYLIHYLIINYGVIAAKRSGLIRMAAGGSGKEKNKIRIFLRVSCSIPVYRRPFVSHSL